MLNTSTHRPAKLPFGHPPVLCIVVDTEEEFDWSAPFSRNQVGTSSVAAQCLAHAQIYDRLGIIPTYVIDWPVATTPTAIATLRGLQDEGRCEIGAHLHPWVSPPHTEAVGVFNSYAGNLPPDLEFAKLDLLTHAIQDNFQRQPLVFKAGRYGLGSQTSVALQRLGYRVDASVVPCTSFSADGGPDFSMFDNHAYWFGSGSEKLLELPVTTGFCGVMQSWGHRVYPWINTPLGKTFHLGGVAARTRFLERIRLTPEGVDLAANKRLMKALVRSGIRVLTLSYHSPSLVPGNTPYVRTPKDLEQFLNCISECCEFFCNELGGCFMPVSQLHQTMMTQ